MNNELAGGVGFLHVRVLKPGTSEWENALFLVCFLLDFSTYTSPVWGSPKCEICFSWSHLDEFWERMPRQDRRSMWATHLCLVVTAFCSRPRLKFVRSWLSKVSFVSYVPGTWTLVPAPGPRCTFFFPFFFYFFPTNTRGLFAAACCCCIFVLFRYFLRFFLRQSVCATAGWWLYD